MTCLEFDQKLALKEFKVYLRKYQIKGRGLVFQLRFYINDWLAQPARVTMLKLDSRPPSEVIAIADFIEADFTARWQKKSAATRSKKKDPSPRKDPRNLRLI